MSKSVLHAGSKAATIAWRGASILGALCVLGLIIAWLSGAFTTKVSPGQTEPAVRQHADEPVGRVEEVTKDYVEEALGTLRAAERTAVSSKILARIDKILVDADDEVTTGKLLIQLQPDELEARLNQARETLTAAQARQEEARTAFTRIERLKEQNAATQAQYDAARAQVDVTEADVRRAEQALAEATTMLSYTQIAAPKDGRIVDRLAEPGDIAVPGQPLLTLYDPQSLRLEVPVREDLALKLTPGTRVTVAIDALDRELEGTVDQRVPQAQAASRSFLIKVALPATDDLFEGMFGRLKIPAGSRRHLCLPESALREIGQLEFVDVVEPDGTITRRFVKTGRRGLPGKVEVLSGVEAGEQVVIHHQE